MWAPGPEVLCAPGGSALGQTVGVEWRLLEAVPGEQMRRVLEIARRRTFAREEVVFMRVFRPTRCT
jgi:hypothetical protein